jgi:hypothetical protein
MLYVNGDSDPNTIDVDFSGAVLMCDSSGTPADIDSTTHAPVNRPITLYIWLKEGSKIRLPGNADFSGYIYGPGASVDVNGCDHISGSISGKVIGGVGGTMVTYVPVDSSHDDPAQFPILQFTKGLWSN